MKLFGLVVMTDKAYLAERKLFAGELLELHDKARCAEAETDATNRHIERLLHNGAELALLWAAVRECGVKEQVRVVYERLRPREKGVRQ